MSDWLEMLDALAKLLRERDRAVAELEAGHEYVAELRERLRELETILETDRARRRVRGLLPGDPERLRDAEIVFGQSEVEAVRVPSGSGTAQFLYGLTEIALTDDKPLYFRLMRPSPGEQLTVAPEHGGRKPAHHPNPKAEVSP